jgi:hypothetical protein
MPCLEQGGPTQPEKRRELIRPRTRFVLILSILTRAPIAALLKASCGDYAILSWLDNRRVNRRAEVNRARLLWASNFSNWSDQTLASDRRSRISDGPS